MPVSFRCPECNGLLSVPKKYVGQTISCPHNGCAVKVPAETPPGVSSKLESHSGIVAVTGNGQHAKPQAAVAPTASQETSVAQASRPPKPPKSLRTKVARFITADESSAAVKLAADGKLPELTLAEGANRRSAAEDTRESNPLTMISALCLSFGLSAILLMIDFGTPAVQTDQQVQARRELRNYYKDSRGELQRYQQYLRTAQQAYSRGDRETERTEYRKVLVLLRAEGRGKYWSLTRTGSEDRKLEELLAVLLTE